MVRQQHRDKIKCSCGVTNILKYVTDCHPDNNSQLMLRCTYTCICGIIWNTYQYDEKTIYISNIFPGNISDEGLLRYISEHPFLITCVPKDRINQELILAAKLS